MSLIFFSTYKKCSNMKAHQLTRSFALKHWNACILMHCTLASLKKKSLSNHIEIIRRYFNNTSLEFNQDICNKKKRKLTKNWIKKPGYLAVPKRIISIKYLQFLTHWRKIFFTSFQNKTMISSKFYYTFHVKDLYFFSRVYKKRYCMSY